MVLKKLFLLIFVCSNKIKFSCKYASQLKPELNFWEQFDIRYQTQHLLYVI